MESRACDSGELCLGGMLAAEVMTLPDRVRRVARIFPRARSLAGARAGRGQGAGHPEIQRRRIGWPRGVRHRAGLHAGVTPVPAAAGLLRGHRRATCVQRLRRARAAAVPFFLIPAAMRMLAAVFIGAAGPDGGPPGGAIAARPCCRGSACPVRARCRKAVCPALKPGTGLMQSVSSTTRDSLPPGRCWARSSTVALTQWLPASPAISSNSGAVQRIEQAAIELGARIVRVRHLGHQRAVVLGPGIGALGHLAHDVLARVFPAVIGRAHVGMDVVAPAADLAVDRPPSACSGRVFPVPADSQRARQIVVVAGRKSPARTCARR